MTYGEFLNRLSRLSAKFYLLEGKSIRTGLEKKYMQCPLTAVCLEATGKFLGYKHWGEAAELLSMDADLAEAIVAASDATAPYDQSKRFDLLRVIGLLQ